MSQPRPSSRSAIGMFAIIFGLMLYAFGAAAIGDQLVDFPVAVQMIFYLIAGIAWIFPVRFILVWMAGKKKSQQD